VKLGVSESPPINLNLWFLTNIRVLKELILIFA